MLTVYCSFRRERISLPALRARLGCKIHPRATILQLLPRPLHALFSFTQGEAVDGDDLVEALNTIQCDSAHSFSYEDGVLSRGSGESLILPEKEMLTFVCKDGSLSDDKGLTVAHFSFIADFVSEHPGEEVPIPFLMDDFLTALAGLDRTRGGLAPCWDVISFLNPVHNAYPLVMDLEDCSLEMLKSLVVKLTEEERDLLTTIAGGSHIPFRGREHYILAALPDLRSLRGSLTIVYDLLSDCPSWLFLRFSSLPAMRPLLCKLVHTADFSLDSDYIPCRATADRIQDALQDVLSNEETETWEQVSRILVMLGYQNEELLNEGLAVSAPYGAAGTRPPLFLKCKEKLRALYPGTWNDDFLR